MSDPKAARDWQGVDVLTLRPGLELVGFEDPTQIDDFNAMLAGQMLSVWRYGDIEHADEFRGSPSLYSHSSRGGSEKSVAETLSQPVITHAYTLEDIRVGCAALDYRSGEVRFAGAAHEVAYHMYKTLRQIAVAQLRSRLSGDIISAIGVRYSLEMFNPYTRKLGSVAVSRQIESPKFRTSVNDLFRQSRVKFHAADK